jgi:hypothetical protein
LGGDDLTRNNAGSNWVIGIDPEVSGALALLKIDESSCSAQVILFFFSYPIWFLS